MHFFSLRCVLYRLQKIKKIKKVPILLGGHCATFMHKAIIEKYYSFDLIIRGEGESAIAALP